MLRRLRRMCGWFFGTPSNGSARLLAPPAGSEASRSPHAKNVPGPFYVEQGCCTACGVPMAEAPGLFILDAENHCYVCRQPSTTHEIDHTLRAAFASEMECIRYRGNDPDILRRFAQYGKAYLCDIPPSAKIIPVVRDVVVFDTDSPQQIMLTALDLAQAFRRHLLLADSARDEVEERFRLRVMQVAGDPIAASLSFAWFEDNFHSVEFRVIGAQDGRWQIRHMSADRPGGRGVSITLDDWLKGVGHFCRIRWYSSNEALNTADLRPTPF